MHDAITDCEATRQRAVELLRAEIAEKRRAERITLYRLLTSLTAALLAVTVFSIAVFQGTLARAALVVVSLVLLGGILWLVHDMEMSLHRTLTRIENARLAIIDSNYDDCVGGRNQ